MPTRPVAERLALLSELTRVVRGLGIEVWIGGNSARVRDLALAEADAWNCWDCPPAELAELAQLAELTASDGAGPPAELAMLTGPAERGPCRATWGGPPPSDGDLEAQLAALADAGASWAIYGPPPSTDWPAFVTKLAGAAKGVQ